MSRTALRTFVIVGVLGSTVFHILSLSFLWYRTIETLDKYQHFFGGMVVAVFVLYWAFEEQPHLLRGPWFVQWAVIVGIATFLGVGWEIFEYTFDNYWGHLIASNFDPAQPSLDDTMRDLLADIGGAFLGMLLFWRGGGKS